MAWQVPVADPDAAAERDGAGTLILEGAVAQGGIDGNADFSIQFDRLATITADAFTL